MAGSYWHVADAEGEFFDDQDSCSTLVELRDAEKCLAWRFPEHAGGIYSCQGALVPGPQFVDPSTPSELGTGCVGLHTYMVDLPPTRGGVGFGEESETDLPRSPGCMPSPPILFPATIKCSTYWQGEELGRSPP